MYEIAAFCRRASGDVPGILRSIRSYVSVDALVNEGVTVTDVLSSVLSTLGNC